jgi:crossover junction endodeoxyribonuclease RusA
LDEAELLLEFCVEGPPVSAQARNRTNLQKWQEKVATEARTSWGPIRPPFRGNVDLTVTYYQLGNWRGDNDNMLKPIQDALQGIASDNDRQVRNNRVHRRNLKGKYTVHRISLVLAHAFAKGPEFLHVRVGVSPVVEDLV